MRFDWLAFCKRRGIRYVAEGSNVAKGNINIHCPWCGAADKSEHLGLSLDPRNPVWGCWRSAKHRGRDPVRLVGKLLGIAYGTAQALVELDAPSLDEFEAAVEALRNDGQEEKQMDRPRRAWLEPPKEFRPLTEGSVSYRSRFTQYLASRGFDNAQEVASDYELWYALSGPFAWRVIFPVRESGNLVGWTGRDIREEARLRYLTSEDMPTSALLEFPPHQKRADTVIVCEGPFDALKLDVYGRELGVAAVATMGSAGAPEKWRALSQLRKSYANMCILFDADAMAQGLALAGELDARWLPLPEGVKDAGEMNPVEAEDFLRETAELV